MTFLYSLPAWDGAFAALMIIATILATVVFMLILSLRQRASAKYWKEQYDDSENRRVTAERKLARAEQSEAGLRAMWRHEVEENVKLRQNGVPLLPQAPTSHSGKD